jgi:hypothetical protein
VIFDIAFVKRNATATIWQAAHGNSSSNWFHRGRSV